MTFEQLIAKSAHLKRLLVEAKAKNLRGDAPGLANTIAQLETQILLIKLHLNSVY